MRGRSPRRGMREQKCKRGTTGVRPDGSTSFGAVSKERGKRAVVEEPDLPPVQRVLIPTVPFLVLFVFGYWYTGLLSLLQGRFERFSTAGQEFHEKPYPMGI